MIADTIPDLWSGGYEICGSLAGTALSDSAQCMCVEADGSISMLEPGMGILTYRSRHIWERKPIRKIRDVWFRLVRMNGESFVLEDGKWLHDYTLYWEDEHADSTTATD